ncbi:MAG: UrcA family protein [Steroidobacteraceae bacterium]
MNTSNPLRLSSKWVWALAAISCTLAAGTASASRASDELPSVTVKYGDLDLSTTAGATALYGRIKRAARTVCGMDSIQPEERVYGNWKPCYNQAIATAVTKVNSPMLTAVHGGKATPARLAALLNEHASAQ